jgi:hypothetical protein
MNSHATDCDNHAQYELRFSHLFDSGRGYSFPCDANGRVDLDGLSESVRSNYFFARALVGRDLSVPFTRPLCRPTSFDN